MSKARDRMGGEADTTLPIAAAGRCAAIRRVELCAFAVFCAVNLIVPLVITDLFPFSRAPMFADAPRRYCAFKVLAPDGSELRLSDFALQRNYWGNPLGVGCGFRPPESLEQFGAVPTDAEVKRHVEEQLARFPDLQFVDVIREVTGPIDAYRVGQLEWKRWRVPNPYLRQEAAP